MDDKVKIKKHINHIENKLPQSHIIRKNLTNHESRGIK